MRAARRLDAAHHAGVLDPDARPVLRRLLGVYVHVLGLSVGAFAEADPMVHTLLRHTADAAAARFWREAGSAKASSSVSITRGRPLMPVHGRDGHAGPRPSPGSFRHVSSVRRLS